MTHPEASGGDELTRLFTEIADTMGATGAEPAMESAPPPETGNESAPVIDSFYSGMMIVPSPVRDELINRLTAANSKWKRGWFDIELVWEANALADTIGELPGVEVIQGADHIANNNNRCAHYVFGECMGEEWAMPDEELGNDIWNNTTQFLRGMGYEQVDRPRPGDVAVYTSEPSDDGLQWVEHFALMEDDGRAVSRFGPGPVVRHDLPAVPASYGTHVFFFRKTQ